MQDLKRRASDHMQQKPVKVAVRENTEQIRDMLQTCISEHRKSALASESKPKFLDREFNNPVPELLRRFIRAFTIIN